jgi:hypothetical protein
MEVTPWDVPVWYLDTEDNFLVIPLHAYEASDRMAVHITSLQNPTFHPHMATDLESIVKSHAEEPLAGEVDLLDAMSYYHRGRYENAITSLVTSIEVLLESRLREELNSRGISPSDAEHRIFQTRNNFGERLRDYCELTGRRVPGPYLSYLPTINGLRLSAELQSTRNLRHEILHSGRRLDRSLDAPMQRAVETMTWFFDWLSNSRFYQERQKKNFSFFNMLRFDPKFEYSIAPDGVKVFPKDYSSAESFVISSLDLADIDPKTFLSTLHESAAQGKDLEHFVRMALAKLEIRHLTDSPLAPPEAISALPCLDRYRFALADRLTAIFIVDLPTVCDARTVEQVATAVAYRARQGTSFASVLCVVNDQNGMPWTLRLSDSISEEAERLAECCGISLIKSDDLARLALGVRSYGWFTAETLAELLKPGWVGRTPPGGRFIGTVGHFYSKLGVVSIDLSEGVKIREGDFLVYRHDEMYYQECIECMQQNFRKVEEALEGKVGIKVSLARREFRIGSPVFVVPKERVSEEREPSK